MIRENDYGKLSSCRPFVVVCPTYGWQIPHVLGNWLKKTRLSGSRKLYFVMTCGDGIGNAGGYAKRFCEKKGMEYMGCGKVVMPENYVDMFPCRTGRRQNGSSGRLSPRRTRSQNTSEKRIRFRRRRSRFWTGSSAPW